jgi:glycerol dehydrogenase
MKPFGSMAYAVIDPLVKKETLPQYQDPLTDEMDIHFEKFGGEAPENEINRLSEQARRANSEIILESGSGKTLDSIKAVEYEWCWWTS